MPVISREKMKVAGPASGGNAYVDFTKVINYEVKRQAFTIVLPTWIKEAMGYGEVSGKTQEEVERAFNKVRKDYIDSIKNVKKVIAYLVQLQGYATEGKTSDNDYKILKRWDDISFFNGDLALGLGYRVLNETEINGKKSYQTLAGSHYNVTGHHTVIPWSEQAEAFFENSLKSLQDLMLNVDKFFGDKDKVIEHIEANPYLIAYRPSSNLKDNS